MSSAFTSNPETIQGETTPVDQATPIEQPILVPEVAVFETERSLTLEIDVPGVERDQAEVTVENQVLTVSASQSTRHDDYAHEEIPSGRFVRTFRLNSRLDTGAMSARLDSGVLRIEIPLASHHQPRQIDISS